MGEYPDLRDEKREEEASNVNSLANISFEDLEDNLCLASAGGKIRISGTETVLERMNAEEYLENRDIDYEIVDSFLSEMVENVPDDLENNIDSRESFDQFAVTDPLMNIQKAATTAYETVTKKENRDTDLESGLGYQLEQSFRYQKDRGIHDNWMGGAIEFIENLTTEGNDGRILRAVDLMSADQNFDDSTVRSVSGVDEEEYNELSYSIEDSKVSCVSLSNYIEGVSEMLSWREDY